MADHPPPPGTPAEPADPAPQAGPRKQKCEVCKGKGVESNMKSFFKKLCKCEGGCYTCDACAGTGKQKWNTTADGGFWGPDTQRRAR